MSQTITISLTEALMRRKELKKQYDLRSSLQRPSYFAPQVERRLVDADNQIDEISGRLPRLNKKQVDQETDWYSQQLRIVDQHIQQANHTSSVTIEAMVMKNFITDEDVVEGTVTETLASLLTRRSFLFEKVQSEGVAPRDLFVTFNDRCKTTDGLDKLTEDKKSPITASKACEVSAYYARALRFCDTAIHQTNTATILEMPESVMQDFE